MFLYSHILGHNIVGCLQGVWQNKSQRATHVCVRVTQYEDALRNTVLGNEAKFQERESVYLLQILKALFTGPLSGLSEFRKLSE